MDCVGDQTAEVRCQRPCGLALALDAFPSKLVAVVVANGTARMERSC
jgi:hypothetical protein